VVYVQILHLKSLKINYVNTEKLWNLLSFDPEKYWKKSVEMSVQTLSILQMFTSDLGAALCKSMLITVIEVV